MWQVKKNKFYFLKSITDDSFTQVIWPPGVYEIETLNKEIKRIFIEERHYTEANYSVTVKPNFSTLGSIIEISTQGPPRTLVPNDSIRDLLEFNETTIYEEYNQSPNPVDISSFDNVFLECDIAKGMIFKSKRSRLLHYFTMDVDPGYKHLEKFRWILLGIWWNQKMLFQVFPSN